MANVVDVTGFQRMRREKERALENNIGGETKKADESVVNSEEKPLKKMTETELEEFAAKNGIDLSGLSLKADKLARIQKAIANAGEKVDFDTEE